MPKCWLTVLLWHEFIKWCISEWHGIYHIGVSISHKSCLLRCRLRPMSCQIISKSLPDWCRYFRKFDLNATSGEIKTKAELDYDVQSQLSLMVIARDRGEEPQEAQAEVVIYLRDVNDNAPVFDKTVYTGEKLPCFLFSNRMEDSTNIYDLVNWIICNTDADASKFRFQMLWPSYIKDVCSTLHHTHLSNLYQWGDLQLLQIHIFVLWTGRLAMLGTGRNVTYNQKLSCQTFTNLILHWPQ